MRRIVAVLIMLAGCSPTSPRMDAGLSVTPEGVRVNPSARVRLGGVGVTVHP